MTTRLKLWSVVVLVALVADGYYCACPTDWRQRNEYCYNQQVAEMPWNEAEGYCQQQGGHLVSFADVAERDWTVSTFISGTGTKWWIGLNDIAAEGNFQWSDQSSVNTGVFNWMLDEPNDEEHNEDCVLISDEVQQVTGGNWQDKKCSKKRGFICKMHQDPVPDCDETNGFKKHGSYCYKTIEQAATWTEANSICQNGWNAELTAVTSDDEQTYIFGLMQGSTNVDTWIGLSDTRTAGTLTWSNGHDVYDSNNPSIYTNWAPGEPMLRPDGLSCVKSTISLNGQWNVADCKEYKPFICRKGLRGVCPDGWIYGNGKCYEVVLNSNFYLTWTEANRYCLAKNARLLELKTDEEALFIAAFQSSLYKEGVTKLWLGISDIGHDQVLTWADGDPLNYVRWASEPNPRSGQDDCTQIYTGRTDYNWELVTCYSQQAFACEVHEGTPLSDIPREDIYWICPDGWHLLPPFCYYVHDTGMNWQASEEFCNKPENGNGHLASIHNSAQQSFISGQISAQSWIGLNDIDQNDVFVWTDGTPYNFTNWKVANVPQPDGNGDCVRIIGITDDNAWGQWNDQPCENEHPPVCQRAAVHTNDAQPVPTLPPDANEVLCGSGYLHNPSNHKCYRVYDEISRTWADARLECQNDGGDLASINSPDEQGFVQSAIALSARQIAVWIGGLDSWSGDITVPVADLSDGGWRWSDGSAFNYINWNAGEPNNVNDEDCIEMQVSGGNWNDLKCSDFRGFVCEKEDPDHTTDPPATDCNGVDCCYRHLGVERGGSITDDQLSASSQRDKSTGANRGRLNTMDQYVDILDVGPGAGGWVPLQDQPSGSQWIQVDLQNFYEVRGVITQGLNGLSQPVNQNMWTTKISVSYKTHKQRDTWEPIRDSTGATVEFDANYDQNTQVTNIFPRPVIAAGIRIYLLKCRLGCALRFELVGCTPECANSLGNAAGYVENSIGTLDPSALTASSSAPDYGPENSRLDYTESVTLNPTHDELDSNTLTWDSAREYCFSKGADLCSYDEICPDGNPIITGVLSGDQWAPIRDSYNDWVEIGDDNTPSNPGRVCWKHNENYGAPSWGVTTGECPPWNTEADPCPHKSNVFCCPGNAKCWKPNTNDAQQWIQADLGQPRKVSGMLLQGNPQISQWVTEYSVQFSDDGSSFIDYLGTDGKIQIFPGSESQNSINEGFFREPITTRYVRIKPVTWSGEIAIRFDVIGCNNEALVTCRDTAENFPETFTVDCPSGCDSAADQVYGTGVYSENSYICAAAIHDGQFLANHGGTVDIKKINGRSSYAGSTQNGITSKDYSQTEKAFIFQSDHLGCPNGWVGWQDWCYYTPRTKLDLSVELNYADARSYCQNAGGELVSIHSQAEHDFVTTLFMYQYALKDGWIGLNDLKTFHYYEWTDGTPVEFTKWDVNEPNGDDERCVEMWRYSGLWNDRACDAVNNVLCKMDKYPVNQDQTVVDGCDAGWRAFEGSCYFIDQTRMVWENAEKDCKYQGGHLTAINNAYEQMWLLGQIADITHSSDDEKFFIGLGAFINPDSPNLDYRWSTGEAITFTAWDNGQPDIKHTCAFPFLYKGIEYYNCIEEGWPARVLGPWCSADPVFTNHPVACNGWSDGQVGCFRMDSISGLWSQGQPFACGSDAYRICEKPRVGYTNPAPPTTPSANGNCPYGWYGSAQSSFCYQINEMTSTNRLNWEEANINCQSQGAQLVSMHSLQEEQIIASGVAHSSGNDRFWIGMKRSQTGSYGWTDGTPISYTNWAPGEPNDYDSREECGEAYYGSDGSMSWNDMNCAAAQNWICKVLRGTTLFPSVTPPPGTYSPQICGYDVDWVAYRPTTSGTQYCYYFSNENLGFYNAGQRCQALGGNLVSIHSRDEQAFITGRTSKIDSQSFWIGLVEDGLDGYYVWVDKTPLDYTNWWGGEPNDWNGDEVCVELDHSYGEWNDNNCGRTAGYICKKLVGATPVDPQPTPAVPGGCKDGWQLYGSKCFLAVGWSDNSMRKNWTAAETYCQAQGGHLASVPNQYYNAFLISLMWQVHSTVWIGLNTIGNDRVFLWSDNEAVTYTNWEVNEPNAQGTEECVEMYTSGRWNDKECDAVKPFICNAWRSSQYPEPTPDDTGCPDGYVRWDTGCYKLYHTDADQMSWTNARAKCQDDGIKNGITIDLVSIWNWYENAFLKAMFWPEAQYDYTWIGLYYNHSQTNGETQFMWSDQSTLYYTNWETNQPQQISSEMGCVEMRNYGTWSVVAPSGPIGGSDDSCNSKRPFVCKHETLVIPTSDPGLGDCDPDWVALGDYCYYVKPGYTNTDKMSWGDAESGCIKRSGNLVSIHSDIENKAIDTWTGSNNVWVGLKRNAWGGWAWSDTSPVDFTNWYAGEPNNVGETGEACTELYKTGEWNDVICSNARGYVCKKHKTYSTCNYPAGERTDCEYSGINEYECLERGCCYDSTGSAEMTCYYSRADAACLEKGGQCKDYKNNICELGYEQSLCSLGNENRCCFQCAADDQTCQDQVSGWEEGDDVCESGELAGRCQYNTNYCAGTYYSGYCGGPGERQCCSSKAPATDKPPMTEPHKTPGTGTTKTTTKNTPGTGTTTKKTTPKTTSGPIDEPVDGGGISGGAIAGIVITVVFLVVGGGLAFYYHKKGGMPSMGSLGSYVPSFGSKSQYDDVPASFENPIVYMKDSEDGVNGIGDQSSSA